MEQKGRLIYIDALRGFAILLVVLGHVLQLAYGNTDNIIFRYIYSFHMPLFMFLSGYVSYKITSWQNMKKRFFQLIVPFFSYIVIAYVVSGVVKETGASLASLLNHIWSVILQPDLGLWFLWALFFINLIFIGCRKFSTLLRINEWVVIISVGGILNLIELITRFEMFGYHWIAWYFLFFSVGVYWRQFNMKEHAGLDKWLLIVSAVLFPICSYCFKMHNQQPTFYSIINLGPYFPIFYRMLVAVIGIILFYELFKKYVNDINNILWRCFVSFGQASMGIYFIHSFFLSPICKLLLQTPSHLALWLGIAVAWIMISAISYLLYYLLSKNKYTQFFILGNNTLFRIKN